MKKFFRMFKIRREEMAASVCALCVLIALHAMMISKTSIRFCIQAGRIGIYL